MRTLAFGLEEKTIMISLRVPANVLRAFKARAQMDNRKYQSTLVQLMRESLEAPTPPTSGRTHPAGRRPAG